MVPVPFILGVRKERKGFVRLAGAVMAAALLFSPPAAGAVELTTTIDLNYNYTQRHLGDDISGTTKVSQKYLIEYESSLTSILDLLAKVRVDYEETTEDLAADKTDLAPTLELSVQGERMSLDFSYDASRVNTGAFEDDDETETFTNSLVIAFEVQPLFWPEVEMEFTRKRDYEEQTTESVDRDFDLILRKEAGDLRMEFAFQYEDAEVLIPEDARGDQIEWIADIAYQSTAWWDIDVDLNYRIEEVFTEIYRKDLFSEEEKDYVHEIQARFKKSLVFSPRLEADISYEYEFDQDLLQINDDYQVIQTVEIDVDYDIFEWLNTTASWKRDAENVYNLPPDEDEEVLNDSIALGFTADPLRWLSITGKAEWEFNNDAGQKTGQTIIDEDTATYEVAVHHTWGDWWDLTVVGSSEFEYTDDWLTSKQGAFKSELKLEFIEDLDLDVAYEIERTEEYAAFDVREFSEERDETFEAGFSYKRDFSSLLSLSVGHDFEWTRDRELDEVLNFEEIIEISESTEITLEIEDFIRGMTLEGSVTRKASDVKDDDEPLLVDIVYELAWEWEIRDLKLSSDFSYEDSGESFDEASFRSKVSWRNDNFDIRGEYQFDKTYSEETNENRQVNLSMKVTF
jgi:hypothetical protein